MNYIKPIVVINESRIIYGFSSQIMSYILNIEGSDKTTRGGECESIKILYENLPYVRKHTISSNSAKST
jgi:hypothetical protein